MECMNKSVECEEEVEQAPSRSGASVYRKCQAHWAQYDERMNEVEADLQRRYPGYDNPHSSPPDWFDPAYAGEEW